VSSGAPVDASAYSATGALVRFAPTGVALLACTATVIEPRAVLTAAHCVAPVPGNDLAFTTSADATNVTRAGSIPARRTYAHPLFDPKATGSFHDIAIVELAAPVPGVVADHVLAAGDSLAPLAVGAPVTLVGYGSTRGDGRVGLKNAALAHVASIASDEMVIGLPGAAQNCNGDSGGPAFVVGTDGVRRIAGVASRSANDTTECVDGSIHTRVDAYASFVATTLEAIARDDPPSAAPRWVWVAAAIAIAGSALVVARSRLRSRKRRAR
jgi:secreted trypsin-like serine protease